MSQTHSEPFEIRVRIPDLGLHAKATDDVSASAEDAFARGAVLAEMLVGNDYRTGAHIETEARITIRIAHGCVTGTLHGTYETGDPSAGQA